MPRRRRQQLQALAKEETLRPNGRRATQDSRPPIAFETVLRRRESQDKENLSSGSAAEDAMAAAGEEDEAEGEEEERDGRFRLEQLRAATMLRKGDSQIALPSMSLL